MDKTGRRGRDADGEPWRESARGNSQSFGKGYGYTTAELKINLVRPMSDRTGPVRAEGKVIHPGRQVATSEGRLFGPDGKLYAHGTTTCMIFEL